MKIGDLVEYIPSKQVGLGRVGVVMEAWHMDGKTQYLCHWNVASPAGAKTGKNQWYAPAEYIQLCAENKQLLT